MAFIDVGITGLKTYLGWINEAVRTGKVVVNSKITIVFNGNPVPTVRKQDSKVLVAEWADGAYVQIDGLPDPSIERIEIYADAARIFLKMAPDVDITDR